MVVQSVSAALGKSIAFHPELDSDLELQVSGSDGSKLRMSLAHALVAIASKIGKNCGHKMPKTHACVRSTF